MSPRLTREPEIVTVSCESAEQAQTIAAAVLESLSALPMLSPEEKAVGLLDPADVRVEVHGQHVTMTGHLELAEDALRVALDVNASLPDVEGL